MMLFYKQIIRFWKTILVLIVILTLCLIPSDELNKIDLLKFNYEDLVVHLIMFIAFSSFLFNDLQRNGRILRGPAKISKVVMSLCLSLGFTTEILQYVLVSLNRTASISDFLFDFLGTLVGITYMRFIRR